MLYGLSGRFPPPPPPRGRPVLLIPLPEYPFSAEPAESWYAIDLSKYPKWEMVFNEQVGRRHSQGA